MIVIPKLHSLGRRSVPLCMRKSGVDTRVIILYHSAVRALALSLCDYK